MRKRTLGASSPRAVFIAAALGTTLVLAVVLALLAQGSDAYHRKTAEGVLRDYAAFAAEQFTNRAQQRLATGVFPVLNLLAQSGAARLQVPLPSPAGVVAPADAQAQGLLRSTEGFFRLALASGPVVSSPPAADWLAEWLGDSIRAHAATRYQRDWYMAFVWGGAREGHRVAVYTVARDSGGTPRVAYGLLLGPDTVARVLRQIAESAPLLPASLTGGVVLDSLAGVRVLSPGEYPIFTSDQPYASPFWGTRTFDPMFGSAQTEVTLRAAAANRLIIGGVPRSRLPLVLGVLGVTVVLVATAIVQLRREQELARLRGDFVASVSHELRTPLAQIRMFTETLRLGRVRSETERTRSLEIMDQEARRLAHLVDNLLHVARGERNRLQLYPEDIDLGLLLHQVVEGFAPLAAARRMTLTSAIAEGVSARADPSALRQVVLNLLDNAVKYAPAGSVVAVGLERVDGMARITVADQGPGIPAGAREKIWQRFARLDRDVQSSVAGSGIGLAIVRELVTAQRGRCSADDALGGGARFVVELPR